MTHEQLKNVAFNTRIALQDQDVEKISQDLNQLFEYVEALNKLDLSALDSFEHPLIKEVHLRADSVFKASSKEKLLKNAPLEKNGFIVVPKVV